MKKRNRDLFPSIAHLIDKIHTYRYHRFRKLIAEQILRELESLKGKTDKKLIKLSNEYAKEVLGSIMFAPWLYVYSAVNNCFKEGWIPDNYFSKVVLPVIDGGYGFLSDLRPLSNQLFKAEIFPDLAYFVNDLFLSVDGEVLNQNELKEFLFKNRNKIVFKTDNSSQGTGIFFFDRLSFETSAIRKFGNGVFQYYIEQHPFFSDYMPSSVSTIRITTVYEETGHVSVRGCFLRIGRSNEQNVKWASNIVIPVDLDSGKLNQFGFFLNFHPIDKHPDTHTKFSEQCIPHFGKCVSVAIELHRRLPYCRCIGWDMIIDLDNNVKVMEWNGHHTDIKVHEALQGPCFLGLGWEKIWKIVK
jgi:hypothetical protein